MKFLEPKTLRGAMSPIILANWVLAIGIFEYPIGHPRPMISLCWSIAYIFLFVSFATIAESRNLMQPHEVSIDTYRFYFLGSVIFIILFICLGRATSKIVSASIRKLNTVNEIMSKYQIPKEYGAIFKYQIIQLIGAFIFISVMLTLNSSFIFNDYRFRITNLGYLSAMHYMPTGSLIIDYTFANFIRYIGKLFQHLNANLIKCSSQQHNTNPFFQVLQLDGSLRPPILEIHANPHSVRLYDKQWMVHLICNSRKIHQELCSTARTLNKAFGMHILLSITMSCIFITVVLYGIYGTLATSTVMSANINIQKITILISWLIFFSAKILYIVCICSMTTTQAQRMGELIHALDKPTADRQVREEIRAFSFLLMQNPLRFTAGGFFTLNFEMIRSMVGTVTTYLVIMIQLHQSDDPESKSPNDTLCAMHATN